MIVQATTQELLEKLNWFMFRVTKLQPVFFLYVYQRFYSIFFQVLGSIHGTTLLSLYLDVDTSLDNSW